MGRGGGRIRACFMRWELSFPYAPLRPFILLHSVFPRCAECPSKHILTGLREADVRRSRAAPATVDRQEDVGHLADEVSLLLRGEHQVSVSLLLRGESGEDSASNAEIGGAHMRAFFRAFEA